MTINLHEVAIAAVLTYVVVTSMVTLGVIIKFISDVNEHMSKHK